MIEATGIKDGKELEVIITDKRNFWFNDEEDLILESEFLEQLERRHHRGLFYPEIDSPLNYINVLENHFFDYNAKVTTDEAVEQIEHDKDVVF